MWLLFSKRNNEIDWTLVVQEKHSLMLLQNKQNSVEIHTIFAF